MNKRLLSLVLAWAVVHPLFAESYTTNIIDGVATNITTDFVLGDTGPHNFLLITNAGAMTNLGRVVVGDASAAHNNVVTVTDLGSVWHLRDALWFGADSASNMLSVVNGAQLNVERPWGIGTARSASNNLVHIARTRTGVRAATLYLGTYGPANQLLVEEGADAEFGTIIFNSENSSEGGRQTATIRGVGPLFAVTNLLQIGNSPENTMNVSDGAGVFTRNLVIGSGGLSHFNRVQLSGPGTRWTAGDVTVGTAQSVSNTVLALDGADFRPARLALGYSTVGNNFLVASRGRLSPGQLLIGDQQTASGNRLEVVGSGSTLSNIMSMIVGNSGGNNLFLLHEDSYAHCGDFTLGMQFTSSNNQAVASGTNTLWIANRLTVGSAGDFNYLTIEDGANLFASSLLSGGQGGSGNSTRVYGPGSLLSVTNALDLSGGNSLLVTNDARVESGSSVIGSFGPSNVAFISRGSWSNVNSLIVGSQAAENSLHASNVARLYASNFLVGAGDNSDRNRVHISGKGTSLRLANALQLGSWGDTNHFFIGNGATVSASQLHVGGYFPPGVALPAIFPADANIITIEGTNTVVNVTSNISVGYNGSHNRLEVSRGADLTSNTIEVGTRANSTNNTILITDPGTHWRNTNTFLLGSNGYRNSLVVSNGARLSTGPLIIGAAGFPVPVTQFCTNRIGWNEVVVTGEGSVMEIAGRTPIMGRSLSNSLVVTRGGTLRLHEINFDAGACQPDYSNLVLVDGGTLVVTNRLYHSRGHFRVLNGRAEISNVFVEVGPPGRFQVLGGTLRVGSIYASAPAQAEIGDGIHRATLELTSPNNFSSGRIIIARNSVLAGRGSIGGFTNAGTFGTLRTVTAFTNTSLGGSSGFDVWIQGTGAGISHSMLQLSAPFNPTVIEGRLRVALSPSFRPQPTDEFRILTHGNATGAFDNAPHNSRINTIDNLASFRVFYTNNGVLLTDYRSTDLDGDSVEDAWATNYFGHSPLTSAERLSDSDGDGMSNYDEFRAGTDPTNAASALRVTASWSAGSATLRWSCVDGKTYRIHSSNDLQTWSEIVEPTLAFPEPGLCQWTDTGTDAGSPTGQMRFYRVAVE